MREGGNDSARTDHVSDRFTVVEPQRLLAAAQVLQLQAFALL